MDIQFIRNFKTLLPDTIHLRIGLKKYEKNSNFPICLLQYQSVYASYVSCFVSELLFAELDIALYKHV